MPEDLEPTLKVCSPDRTADKKIPLFSDFVAAGFPSPAEDYIEKNLDLNDLLIKHPAATFFVKVSGSSMTDSGINDGDILIVDRSLRPKSGSIAVVAFNGEFTVKRLKKTAKALYLLPENSDHSPIKVTEEMDLIVWGLVTNVIHPVK